ncbi:MAG: phage baseplate assembly protein V [Tepidimonas sp.]|uniref:phage baseplate assembly protein V n=1 Tax=Tepidimonas sp. TaxID=2002775 RepID=UPI00298EE263|nr:phage baseplate assembly protein V [Tepidimonas sp.]MDW8337107.1 phage baseplate assembly protein V [Tepidimonas sp.]
MTATTDTLTLEAADWGRGGTVRLGTVTQFDARRCRVRVRLSEQGQQQAVTDWLPWATWSAGHLRVWNPPAVGEQCMVLSPSGDMAQAVAVPAVFQQQGAYPAPTSNPNWTLLQWDDGGYIRYERDTHRLILHASCAVRIEGDLVVTGDVYSNGVSLRKHKHVGVAPGVGVSGGPTGGEAPPCQ